MKRLASAITLLVASSVATAAEPQVGEKAPMILASYSSYYPVETVLTEAQADEVARVMADNVVRETLGTVSAALTYELESRIADQLPGMPE